MSAQSDMHDARRECIALCDALGLVTLVTKLRAPQHASAWSIREPLAEVYIAAEAIHAAMVTLHETAESTLVDTIIGDTGCRALKLKEAAERAGAAAQRYIEENDAEAPISQGLAKGARRYGSYR